MFFIYTIYGVISNVVSAKNYEKSIGNETLTPDLLSYEGFLVISLGSKQIHETEGDRTSFTVQCWLGVAMIVVWGVLLGFIKKNERRIAHKIDADSKTASDFSILIENFPSKMTKQ